MERHITNFNNYVAGKPSRTEPMRAMKILKITLHKSGKTSTADSTNTMHFSHVVL